MKRLIKLYHDDIYKKTCNNGGLKMYIYDFYDFTSVFKVFINIHEYATRR